MDLSRLKNGEKLLMALFVCAGLCAACALSFKLISIMFGGTSGLRDSAGSNLLLVTLDTCRADHLSLYRYERATSPALEALARDGIVFENAYTVATNSAPSHATLFTGLYPVQHGLVDNGLRMPGKFLTLAEYLARFRYDTAAFIGFYGLGRETGLDQGFRTFELHDVKSHAHEEKELENEMRGFRAALDWIKRWRLIRISGRSGAEQSRGHPFFVWLHAQQIHDSYDPAPPYDSLFAEIPRSHEVEGLDTFDIRCSLDMESAWRKGLLSAEMQDQVTALYDGEIRMVDDSLKVIFDFLKAAGLFEDTLIVVVADHGELLFEQTTGDSGRVAIGHTGKYFEQALRIPLLVKPAVASGLVPGIRLPQMVSSIDLMPTILDLLGLPLLPWLAGQSLVPVLRDPEPTTVERIFFQENPFGSACAGMRTREWKLIRKSHQGSEQLHLFDLINDPEEQSNVIDEHIGKALRMESTLDSWLAELKKTSPSAYADMSERMREELEKAGYIRE